MEWEREFCAILHEELRPAMGCTEPIALAYAAAKARAVLGAVPDRVKVEVSGNILKNVKSVVVPHTGGLRGIAAAVAAGVVAGDETKELEALSCVTEEQIAALNAYAAVTPIEVVHIETPHIFDMLVTVYVGTGSAAVRIADHHTNIIYIEKNGKVLLDRPCGKRDDGLTDRSCLSIERIVRYADEADLSSVADILEQQIACNMAIAEEGMRHDYGANIGKTLLKGHENDLAYRMRAYAAAASDARMNGCDLPVVINSGSGNQGITASVPVIVCAEAQNVPHETLLRALLVSNLVTTHLKTGIGRLSAYCGVVSAGCGAAAGLCYLSGGRFDEIAHTVVNAVAMDSGIICDGAKASCAAKIASAVDAGLLGLAMYQNGNEFFGGDGIVKKGVENTIDNIGRLARVGMEQTDKEIIRLMLET